MGLDNGIIVKGISYNDYPERIRVKCDYWEEEEEEVQIAYWRKCWNVRQEILDAIDKFPYAYTYKLSKEDLFKIIDGLDYLHNKKNWDTNGGSIWEYEEYEEYFAGTIDRICWLVSYIEEHPDADIEIRFYDSY